MGLTSFEGARGSQYSNASGDTVASSIKANGQAPPVTWLDEKKKNEPVEKPKTKRGEQIDSVIGHFGRYQFLIFLFKILIGATSAFNNLGVTFFAPRDFVGHWCSTETNGTLSSNNKIIDNSSIAHLTNYPSNSIQAPGYLDIFEGFFSNNERRERHNSLNFDTNTPRGLRKQCNYFEIQDNITYKCNSYQYDTGIWLSTIIEEWDLVCDKSWLISMTQSLYMSGFIVSYPMFGYISDRFGRWNSLLIGALFEVTGGFGCALSGSITTFMIFRFLVGLGNAGRTSSSYLVMIEWTGPKWRMQVSTFGILGWILGYSLMPWIALYFLHFRHMQLFVCFYEIVFIIWLLRIPESPRWLLTHRRFGEAYRVLLNAARVNGLIKKGENLEDARYDPSIRGTYHDKIDEIKKPNGLTDTLTRFERIPTTRRSKSITETNNNKSENDYQSDGREHEYEFKGHDDDDDDDDDEEIKEEIIDEAYTLDEYNKRFASLVENIHSKEFTDNEDKLTIIDLFKWENLRKYLLILFFVWASNSFVYYGIVLRVGDFGAKNLFVSFTIAGLTEIPSMFFTIICMKYLPRSTTNLIIYLMTSLLCAIQIPLKYYEYGTLQQVTIMLAKLANSCAFACILYQTMEIFPTSIRQTAYSSCSLAGRIGSILAPFVKELAQLTSESVPTVLYASITFINMIFIQMLPETKGSDLHDTLIEAENFKGTNNNRNRKQTANIESGLDGPKLVQLERKRKN